MIETSYKNTEKRNYVKGAKMIKKFRFKKPWWMIWELQLEKDIKNYNRGYRWAAGKLVSGEGLWEVEMQTESEYYRSQHGKFDSGAHDAIEEFRKLMRDAAR